MDGKPSPKRQTRSQTCNDNFAATWGAEDLDSIVDSTFTTADAHVVSEAAETLALMTMDNEL